MNSISSLAVMSTVLSVLVLSLRTKRKTGWHGEMLQCNGCGQAPPMVRMPKSVHECLWGGWTCRDCGTRNEVGLNGEVN